MQGTQTRRGGGKHAVPQRQDSSWVSSCLPSAGQLGSVDGKTFVAGNGLWPRRVATRRANNAEGSGLARPPRRLRSQIEVVSEANAHGACL